MSCYPCIHCNKCGMYSARAKLVCGDCGADLPVGVRACPQCGSKKVASVRLPDAEPTPRVSLAKG